METSTETITLWRKRFADRKSSGLKVDDWCNQNDISRYVYYYWHRKVQVIQQSVAKPVFAEVTVPVTMSKLPEQDQEITIRWKEFSFSVKDSKSLPLIAELMQRLVKEC